MMIDNQLSFNGDSKSIIITRRELTINCHSMMIENQFLFGNE